MDSTLAPFLPLPTQVGGFAGTNEINYGTTGVEPHPDFLNPGQPGYGKIYAIVTRLQSNNLSADFGFGNSYFDLLVEYQANDPELVNPIWTSRTVLTVQQPGEIHNLVDLDFGPDGLLYVSSGDGGDGGATAQDIETIFGNILRINPMDPNGVAPAGHKLSTNGEYSIPLDNPLVGQLDAIEEAWAYGLRSPFTLNFSNNGELYGGDVGAAEREEINKITKGSNQGWGRFEGTRLNNSGISLVPGRLTIHQSLNMIMTKAVRS